MLTATKATKPSSKPQFVLAGVDVGVTADATVTVPVGVTATPSELKHVI